MTRPGRIIVISAPSGGGKTTVIKRFLETHPNTIHSISWTTRPIRPGEAQGTYYHHVDEATFKEGIEKELFVEWAEVHGNYYGTPKAQLEEWLAQGKDILCDLDVVGGTNVKDYYGGKAIIIFLLPPSLEILKERLVARKTDSAEVQLLRLRNALTELTYQDDYDYRVVNDDLDQACQEIEAILNQPRSES